MEKSKISWLITFVRRDLPEYGEVTLTQYVFAKDDEAAVNHIKSCYGQDVEIISVK